MTTATACVFLTGRPGSGKRTVAALVVDELRQRDLPVALLGPETTRGHLVEGPEALAWCCSLLVENGVTTVVAIGMDARDERERLRGSIPGFAEIHLDAPADVCAARTDAPGTGYEEPWAPDLRVPTHGRAPEASSAQVISFLEDRGVVDRSPAHPSARSRPD